MLPCETRSKSGSEAVLDAASGTAVSDLGPQFPII